MGLDSVLSSSLAPPVCEKDAEALQFIEESTRNADAVQQRVLAEILSHNADTEYLRRFGLQGATDPKTFKSRVPVVTYEDIQPEIQRIANGDRSPILSASPVSEFLTSSGTSAGERKLIPTTQEEQDRRLLLGGLFMPVLNQFVQGLDKGKGLYFMFVKSETKTPGGLLARPVLTSMFKSEHFKNRPNNRYTSPNETILCSDSFQSMYTQMLCGLYEHENVLRIGAFFASSLLRVIRFLQLNWAQLVDDIRKGALSSRITDPTIKSCMAHVMRSDPGLADLISSECSKDAWEGIITRIWPNTKYLDAIITGAMAQYIPTLDFYSGGLPLVSAAYASSECFFGLNLKPMCKPTEVSYTILPNMAYFEFLPLDKAHHEVVDLVDVEVGKEYEIVVTTYAGLYRYRVGDILRVTGFHNSAPQFHFVRRKNVLLSIDFDKTDEAELQHAVDVASKLLQPYHTRVVEYTSYTDTRDIPGHYVIYWELMGRDSSSPLLGHVMDACCLAIEESLNSVYRQCRVSYGSIGPLEIRIVRPGTFEELMDQAISRGASINQYKVPRCVNFKPILELLDSRVESAHFSPKLPRWTQSIVGVEPEC